MSVLSNNHWIVEDYAQRITAKQWRAILLNNEDDIFFHGELRKLKAKPLGQGVVEISKEPLNSAAWKEKQP